MKVMTKLHVSICHPTICFLFSPCDKLKDKILEAFTTGMTDVDFTIPVVNNTIQEGKIGTLPI
jgi:hypothetical protein